MGTWSLQRAVRKQVELEKISRDTRDTIRGILHAAGLTWQRDRTWMPPAAGWSETGVSVRTGKHGKQIVIDPDAEAKRNLIERAYLESQTASGLPVWVDGPFGPLR